MSADTKARQLRLADLLHECYGRYLRAAGRISRTEDWLSDADFILGHVDQVPNSASEEP